MIDPTSCSYLYRNLASVFCFWFLCLTLAACSQPDDDIISVAHVYADVGSNISLPCMPQSLRTNTEDYSLKVLNDDSQLVWVREGKAMQHSKVERNGILLLSKVTLVDAGLYTCQAEESYSDSDKTFTRSVAQVELHVKTTPPAPQRLVVYPSSVVALVMWSLNSTGGYPIKSISVIYQEVTDDPDNPSWHRTFPEEVGPLTTQMDIYKLEPNKTYRFRVWASNKLGPGDYAEVKATTKSARNNQISAVPVHGSSHLLTSSDESAYYSPWVLTIGVLIGSLGFTLLVLAFFMLQNQRAWARRTYDSSEDMELVTNIIVNPSYMENERRPLYLMHEDRDDRQALLLYDRNNGNRIVHPTVPSSF